MNKLNIILIIAIIISIISLIIKIVNQEQIEKVELQNGLVEENLRYEVEREIMYGEKTLYSEFDSEGKRVNISEEMKKEQKLDDGLSVKDYNISYKNNFTQIVATVYNLSNEVKGGYPAYLVFYNDQNEELLKLTIDINKVKPNSETKIITGITSYDMSNVYRCEIQKMEGK
ncbi:MAG: hypothetical protein J6J60_07045 [Clostridia bacterium]|nr:hypothetical protein [Clostridia bacterium]